jgi:hypothetical protein
MRDVERRSRGVAEKCIAPAEGVAAETPLKFLLPARGSGRLHRQRPRASASRPRLAPLGLMQGRGAVLKILLLAEAFCPL